MKETARYICAVCALLVICLPAMAADVTWSIHAPNPGNASDPDNWDLARVPDHNDKAILPNQGGFYTALVDVPWHIDDLEIGRFATGKLDGNNLKVNNTSDIYGKLWVSASTYDGNVRLKDIYHGHLYLTNGTVDGSVYTDSDTKITGWGCINNNLTNNDGEIRAQGGELSIAFGGSNHDDGTLYADTGATLYVRNTSNVTNKAVISLAGGTLKGYQHHTYNLINDEAGSLITGHGTISHYHVQNNLGAIIAPNGTLTLQQGFASSQNVGTINLASGATLSVNGAWANYGETNMTGGSIVGSTMTQAQSWKLNVTAGTTNTIQNVIFSSLHSASISNGTVLTITGDAELQNTTIHESSGTAHFNVAGAAVVHGWGTINPDMDISGTLAGNSSGNALTVNGDVTIQPGGSARASNNGTLNLNGDVNNRGSVYTNTSGTVNIAGTIKADAANDGDFTVNTGQININGAIESGVRNIFVANTGGTINFANDLSTATLYETYALQPCGGTITLAAGKTLTNAPGKIISGYGTLLDNGRYLVNSGIIEACDGTLNVHGNIINNGIMRADGGGNVLSINSTLAIGDTGSIYAVNGGTVNLGSDLTNEGEIYAGSGGEVHISDTAPIGKGTFTANDGGAIYFADGFTNAGLTTADALRLAGGRISVTAGNMTNAAGKQIVGTGYLLGGGGAGTLTNEGMVTASGGTIQFEGGVDNFGGIYADGANNIAFSANLDNKSGGIVRATGGATVTCKASIGGAGTFSLTDSQMLCYGSLTMEEDGCLLDNDSASTVKVHGSLLKRQGALDKFDADQITLSIYLPVGLIGTTHKVEWLAEDKGADTEGLTENLALGKLIFGDGVGSANSDAFELFGETNIYVFGLEILSDADVDLGGRTIYYLKDGFEVNGIVGTGFVDEGHWDNGDIVEIPEPATLSLLVIGGVGVLLVARRRRIRQ